MTDEKREFEETNPLILRCDIHGKLRNAIIDSGASCSIIDKKTLESLGSFTISKTKQILRDASNNVMNVIGTVEMHVRPVDTKNPVKTKLYVVETNSCILLGRNFMRKYRKVTFDFENNRIQLNNSWCNGMKMKKNQCIRSTDSCVIPARSEMMITVKCKNRNGYILSEFEPRKNMVSNLYINHAQVIPDADGVFYVSVLNPSNKDMTLNKRTVVGSISSPGESIINEISVGRQERARFK